MWRMASRTPAVRQVAPVARRRTCVEWVAAGVPAVLVLGWFWLPGLVVLRVLAFRGLGLVAVAPLVTLGVLGATAILAERAGVAWGPATAVGGTAIAVGIAWLARRLDRGGRPATVQQAGSARWTVAAVAVGVAAQIVPTFVGMQRPGRLLDAYDAVVHLNTIRYVQESGSASSLTVSGVYSAGQDTGFYPAAWHGVTALVPAWPDPATVFTIAAFLPTAVAWTTGIAFLTRSVFPGRPRAACWAALLSGAGLTLPQVLAQQQAGLIPNALALGALPALLGLFVGLRARPGARWYVAAGVGLVGLGLTHPNAVLSAAVILGAWALQRSRPLLRRASRTMRGRLSLWGIGGALALLMLVTLTAARMRDVLAYSSAGPSRIWDTVVAVATGQMGSSTGGGGIAVVLTAAVGAWSVRKLRGGRPLLAALATMLVLFVAGRSSLPLLAELDRPWFGESKRIAPAIVALLLPLAAVAIDSGGAWLATSGRLRTSLRPRTVSLVLGGVIAATGIAAGALETASQARASYSAGSDADGTFATDDELAMMRRLSGKLEPSGVVLGSPHSGAAHLYGLIGQPVAIRTPLANLSPELIYVTRHIAELGESTPLCGALDSLGVRYLYVDEVMFRAERSDLFRLTEPPADGVRLIETGGTASVYEITACD